MKKILSLLVTAMLGVLTASAQMIAYQVTATVPGTPGEPTVIDLQGTTGTDFSKLMLDADGNLNFNTAEDVKAFPIGFDFGYNGQTMKYFLIGTDGEIQLSPVETVSTDLHKNFNSMFTGSDYHDAFGIILRNGFFGYDDTQISYWPEGAGVLCIQYKNVGLQTASWSSDQKDVAKATIEYRLYQNGNIEMKVSGFKPFDGADVGSYNFMRIGILGDANDFVQIQSYDGSVISASDNTISYGTDNYPADGTVYTFVAPEACQTPAVAPSDVVLTSVTDKISGTFATGSADHFLVLASAEATLTEAPADKTKYTVGQQLGNAVILAIVEDGQFETPRNMTLDAATNYHVFVYGFNSLCSGGPLYNATPATASIATKPSAPEALTVTATDKNSIRLSVTAAASAPVVIAMSDQPEVNAVGQVFNTGFFATPEGDLQVGDVLNYYYALESYLSDEPIIYSGENKVVYVGTSSDDIEITGLQAGKDYYFRAWSSDGQGGYSSEHADVGTVTSAELPWTFELVTYGSFDPVGWTFADSENSIWSSNERNEPPYFYTQANYATPEEPDETWMESPEIYLGNGANTLSVAIAATEIPFRFPADWTMAEGDEIAVQLTTDGITYKNILTLNKDNMPAVAADEEAGVEGGNYWQKGVFSSFTADFTEYAGQKVRLRLYVKRQSKGQVQFSGLTLTNKGGGEAQEATVTYLLSEGDTFASGQTVNVEPDGDIVATITYGEAGGNDFSAASADNHVEGFVAYTAGNGTNGNKAGGTFYTIVPKYNGKIDVAIVLNADKAFYVEEDGTALEDYNGITVSEKYYGTYTFDVKAGNSYKVYCAGSKLGFYGFNYTYTAAVETAVQLVVPAQPATASGIYTMSGQRLNAPQKGLMIIDGKKVLVK